MARRILPARLLFILQDHGITGACHVSSTGPPLTLRLSDPNFHYTQQEFQLATFRSGAPPDHPHPDVIFFRRATTRTLCVCEMAPAVSASLTSSACSCWW